MHKYKGYATVKDGSQSYVYWYCTQILAYLQESNVCCILSEALPAYVQAIFSDKAMPVGTHSTEKWARENKSKLGVLHIQSLVSLPVQ